MLSHLRKLVTAPRADFLTRIPWRRRLETRVMAAIAAIVLVTVAAVLAAAGQIVTGATYTDAGRNFRSAAADFSLLAGEQAESAGLHCRVLARQDSFKRVIELRDR